MKCPACGFHDSRVVDSRSSDDGNVTRRRRECLECEVRFTTYERIEERPLLIVKRSGEREAFDRDKLVRGLSAASTGRPVTPEQLDALARGVEESLRSLGTDVRSAQVGTEVLKRLRRIDEVAYLRFASVYKNFDDADDFKRELTLLEKRSAAKTKRKQ